MGRGTAAQAERTTRMVAALLDTAIVVDVLCLYPPAVAWLGQQGQLGLSTIVWLEIIEGASDRQAEQDALRLLRRFERVETTAEDIDWAIRHVLRLLLSQGVDAMDCLIASVIQRMGIPLYTRNLRHFTPLLGDLARQPY